MRGVRIEGAAVYVAGAWITTREALLAVEDVRARALDEIALDPSLVTSRLERADRPTKLAACAAGRALASLPSVDAERTSVVTASTLASAFTNERFELRRLSGRAPEPRSFPYTAPNAAAGELAIAIGAQGPTLALVGSDEVALTALERATRWIAHTRCDRVVVVAFECPPAVAPERVAPASLTAPVLECAAALVIGHGEPGSLDVRWLDTVHEARAASRLLSVRALADVCLGATRVVAVGPSGGALCATTTP